MKRKFTLLLLLLSIASSSLFAQKFEEEGINYQVISSTGTFEVQVIQKTPKYTGSVSIPEKVYYGSKTYAVTNIGDYAFYSCSALTSVSIGNAVTSIGEEAFNSCSALTSVSIGKALTSIGENAFRLCQNLTEIKVDGSNTKYASIDGVLFNKDKTELLKYPARKTATTYSIPNAVTSIGGSAFSYCSALTSVSIGNAVTSIGRSAFSGCIALTSVSIPKAVTSIGEFAFSGCSALTSVNIPTLVTSIGEYAFEQCTALTSIYSHITDVSKVTMGSKPFNGVKTSTCKLYVPKGKKAAYKAAKHWKDFTNIIEYGFVTGVSLDKKSHTISKGESFTLVATVAPANADKKGITWQSLNPTVASVDNEGKVKALELGLADIVVRTEEGGYTDTCKLSVNIKEEVGEIVGVGKLFYKITQLSPKEVEVCPELSNSPYYNSGNQPQGAIEIPANIQINTSQYAVKQIGKSAFNSCSALTSVSIPTSVTSIGAAAFSACSALTSISIPSTVTSIGASAFSACSALTSVTIPKSVSSIGRAAFINCKKLEEIKVEEGNTNYVSTYAVLFSKDKTTLLQYPIGKIGNTYSIPGTVKKIGSYAFAHSNLTTVTIPNSVNSIGEYAFSECSALASITIPNSVTSIEKGAFSASALTSVSIPSVVSSIGERVFDNCKKLQKIKIEEGNTAYADIDGVLLNQDKTILLQYPAGKTATIYSIPASVTNIEQAAFSGTDALTSVSIPSSVNSIGDYAFSECSALTTVNIPNSIRRIRKQVFSGCSALTAIYSRISDLSKVSMGSNSFDGVNKSTCTLYVPTGKKTAYQAAEYWKAFTNITEYTLVTGVSLNKQSHSLDKGESFTLTATVAPTTATQKDVTWKSLKPTVASVDNAGKVSALKSGIANIVVSTQDGGYTDTCQLSINIIEEVGVIVNVGKLFYKITKLSPKEVEVCPELSNSPYYKSGNQPQGGIEIPANIQIKNSQYTVKQIGASAFHSCSALSSVSIPTSVTSIGASAFEQCTALTSIYSHITDVSKVTMESNPFNGVNTSTCTLYVPTGTKTAYQAAEYWKAFTNIIAHTPVTGVSLDKQSHSLNIGESFTLVATVAPADANQKDVTWKSLNPTVASVNSAGVVTALKGGVTDIVVRTEDGGYTATCKLRVNITEEVGAIVNVGKLFFKITQLSPNKEVEVCPELSSSPYYSSDETRPKGKIEIPANIQINTSPYAVKGVGNFAFHSCSALTSVSIPASVTSIGNYTFGSCKKLTEIKVDGRNTKYVSIDGILFSKDKTTLLQYPAGKTATTYNIPTSVTSIGGGAFLFCSALTSVSIPTSVTSIGSYVFYGCSSLTSVSIPNSVTNIGSSAFSYCSALTAIYSYLTDVSKVTMGSNPFEGVKTNTCKLYVPTGKKAAYQAAKYWKTFTNIIEYNPVTGVSLDKQSHSLNKGESFTLVATITPADATQKAITWKSLNSTVASVSNVGVVTALRGGVTDIVVRTQDGGYTATCKLSVKEKEEVGAIVSVGKLFYKITQLSPNKEVEVCTELSTPPFYSSNETRPKGRIKIPVNIQINNSQYAVKGIGTGAFFTCSALTSVTIPNSVTSIGEGAFASCTALTLVNIPNTLTKIKGGTFYRCEALLKIELPKSIVEIGEKAFANCKALRSIKTNIEKPDEIVMGTSVFKEVPKKTCRLYVPSQTKGLYKSSAQWKEFKRIIVAVNGIKLSESSLRMKPGETAKLVATVLPEDADNDYVLWRSSNSDVLTVSKGVLTAKKAGKVSITATSDEGDFKAICEVTVTVKDGINEEAKNLEFSVYPSVVSSYFTIESKTAGNVLYIYNLMGKKVYEQVLQSKKEEINISHLQSGVYVLRINNEITKIVKE